MEAIKNILIIAFPIIIAGILIYGKSAISIHFLGKISKEALAGGCLAIAMANLSGYSLISVLAIGMKYISLKAYRAQQWVVIGQTLQCTIIILILACIPISILWLNFKPILCMFGQNPTIASIVGTYLACSLPSLLFQSIINPLKIYMRIHNLTFPLMISSAASLAFHLLINYVITHYFGLRIQGIALAGALTDLYLLITLLIFLRIPRACSECWQGWSIQCFRLWKPILSKAVLSLPSVFPKWWWWYELVMILLGILTSNVNAIATFGIIIQATSFAYNFSIALSRAISTKIGDDLMANRPSKAKASSYAAQFCALFTCIVTMLFMVSVRNIWGHIFTQDKAILYSVAVALPVAGICEMGNCLQTTISGILRGSARSHLAARLNWVSFYCVALPIYVLMGYGLGLGLLGFILGLWVAQQVCGIVIVILLARTDWKVQASRVQVLASGIM